MARWRIPVMLAVCGLAVAACGSDGETAPTTADRPEPITFELTVEDSGNALRVRPGDEVVPRLPLTGLEDDGWLMTVSPNPAVLAEGDDLLFFPSEIGQGRVAYQEFSFIAVGPGETRVTLTHGVQHFTFTVRVAEEG